MDYEYEDELDRMRARRRQESRRPGERGAKEPGRTYYSDGPGRNPRAAERSGRNRGVEYASNPGPKQRSGSRNGKNQRDAYSGGYDRSVQQKLREERIRKKKKKKRLLVMELVVLAVLVCGAFFIFGKGTNEKGYWTIAVFGVDSRDGNIEKGALSDVEMICNIDKATGEIKLVSVFRDTYLQIDSDGTYHKINEAYAKGGHKQAVDALNENLDLKIDDYATFNWKAVAQAINILGGVDIEITDAEFAYINSFITETVNSTQIGSYQLEHAGMNHLDGVQAVAYARLRLMDTDFNRTERQRKVVMLALEKAKQADFGTLKSIVSAVFPQISTSIGIDDLFTIARGISKYHIGETAGFPFSRTTMKIRKMDCVIATTLESNVIQLHQFLYNDMDYTPSSKVKSISAKISEVSGISEPGKNAPTGGGSGKKTTKETRTQVQETAPPETEAVTEEITETTAEPETENTEAESTEAETKKDGSLVGPGAEIEKNETSDSKKPGSDKSEEKKEQEKTEAGPSKGTEASKGPEASKGSDSSNGSENSKESAPSKGKTEGPSGNSENKAEPGGEKPDVSTKAPAVEPVGPGGGTVSSDGPGEAGPGI